MGNTPHCTHQTRQHLVLLFFRRYYSHNEIKMSCLIDLFRFERLLAQLCGVYRNREVLVSVKHPRFNDNLAASSPRSFAHATSLLPGLTMLDLACYSHPKPTSPRPSSHQRNSKPFVALKDEDVSMPRGGPAITGSSHRKPVRRHVCPRKTPKLLPLPLGHIVPPRPVLLD